MNQADKNKVFDKLMQLGVIRVEVHFSGGNDEGGADDCTAWNADKEHVKLPEARAYRSSKFNKETKEWEPQSWQVWEPAIKDSRDATEQEIEDSEFIHLLEEPIYDTYGSFAGEFEVDGTLIWDVTEGTVTMSTDESVQHWEHEVRAF